MSELRVDSVKSKGGGAPDLPKGVTISGITTAATLGATTVDVSNVNVSGVVTSGTLSGDLLSTGTPTLGLGVTINSSGVAISGVATAGIVSATTLYGNGSNLTGIAASLAPLFYHPDPSDTGITFGTGIGITFNQQIKAGTGNITIREGSSSGTVVENFGVGSSVTISENRVTFTPSSELSEGVVYHLSYPSGCFTNNEGTDYVGTAYTFQSQVYNYNLFAWGMNNYGMLGLGDGGDSGRRSSPTQVPGTTWKLLVGNDRQYNMGAIKTDNTLWGWGVNDYGGLGQNDTVDYSSPIQIPGTNWSGVVGSGHVCFFATKTDGTLWAWGYNDDGQLMQNNRTTYSSPVQIGSATDWSTDNQDALLQGWQNFMGIKNDGTLWAGGANDYGEGGTNENKKRSSPVQVPGTTWAGVWSSGIYRLATKTDGTAWAWGYNDKGNLGLNNKTNYSSPVQIGSGTDWNSMGSNAYGRSSFGIKTDGTMWSWGYSHYGTLGLNQGGTIRYSSPVQIPGTTWKQTGGDMFGSQLAVRTDGTLWAWGRNEYGGLGLNNRTNYSSPVQVPGTTWTRVRHSDGATYAFTEE